MAYKLHTSFYFLVSIQGMNKSDMAFKEVSGLSKELGTEEVVCGGENRFKYRLPTITTYQNLILRRGVTNDKSPLVAWVKKTLDGGFSSPVQTKNIMVQLLDERGNVSISWSFVSAYPLKWVASDLKSQESELFIETIEFAYQYFEVKDGRVENTAMILLKELEERL